MQHITETTKQYQRRHIFTDGRRCASLCLHQREFCYCPQTAEEPATQPPTLQPPSNGGNVISTGAQRSGEIRFSPSSLATRSRLSSKLTTQSSLLS